MPPTGAARKTARPGLVTPGTVKTRTAIAATKTRTAIAATKTRTGIAATKTRTAIAATKEVGGGQGAKRDKGPGKPAQEPRRDFGLV